MTVPRALHEALYEAYVAELRRRYPRLVILEKGKSPLCRLIDKTLKILTFGGQSEFLTGFVTTLGSRIYVPDDWQDVPAGQRYCTLRHEVVHVEQFRRYTWPAMVLLYLLLPVPVGFAGGRAFIEWQAYRETLRAHWQVYGAETARSPQLADHIAKRFTGPEYAWMWVLGKQVRTWIANEVARLEREPPPELDVSGLGSSTSPAPRGA